MKRKNLEKTILLSLILSSNLCSIVFADDLALEQKNLHFRDGYSKNIDGSLNVNLTATGGVGSGQNFVDDDFKSNEGTGQYNNKLYGIAVALWDKAALIVGEDLSISVKPADWSGSKYDTTRMGIEMRSNAKLEVGGNTKILVDNYKHSNSSSNLATDEDYGMNSQKGITVTGDNISAVFEGDLDIEMLNGNRSFGIYATGDTANLVVEGDTRIIVKDAPYYTYGISNQYSDQKYSLNRKSEDARLQFKGDLSITTEGGNNSIGINIKDSVRNAEGINSITVAGKTVINVSGAEKYESKTNLQEFPDAVSNYGIFMNNVESATFNDAEIITVSNGDDVESVGTYLYNSNNIFKGNVRYDTSATDNNVEISALARNGSNLTYEKGFIANGNVALNAVGKSIINVNNTNDASCDVKITGNIVVGKTTVADIENNDTQIDVDEKNEINVNFLTGDSYFTGINEFGNDKSEINLTFKNGSTWNMIDSSAVTDLDVSADALVDMTYDNSMKQFRVLRIDNLTGSGGTIKMNVDASKNVENSDRIFIDGKHEGIHYLDLNNVGVNTEGADKTVLVSVNDEQGEFRANDKENTLYWDRYELKKKNSSTEGYNFDWILNDIVHTDKTTTTVDTVLSVNSLNYHTWRTENDKLLQRMGELRHNGEEAKGAWFRVNGSKIGREGKFGFENEYTAYELGYDEVTKRTEEKTRYQGTAISYTDGSSSYSRGSGDNSSKAISFYNTEIGSKGHYLDLVLKISNMDNDFTVYDTNSNKITGDFNNIGVALSAEYGRKNALKNGWYIEPQTQFTLGYLGGDSYTASNGIEVNQSGIKSAVGRIGFNIGKEIGGKGIFYAKANLLHEFGGDYDVSMTDSSGRVNVSDSFNDTWFEYGVGAAFASGKNSHVYFDVERSSGSDFTKDWQWNIGARWSF